MEKLKKYYDSLEEIKRQFFPESYEQEIYESNDAEKIADYLFMKAEKALEKDRDRKKGESALDD